MENSLSTYSGGCHCGKIKYSVDVADDTELIECNCSICRRAGWLLVFVGESAFRLEGDPPLTDYLFHKEEVHHTFCPTCGVRSFSKGALPDGSVLYAVNMRCTDADLSTFKVKEYDGASV